ncbi:sodium/hydrogen exchanger 9B2-like [Euwallacea similis]|uniref:sodium/hydrogen exchanger 9B2-like n=1 Tax=Euwallacea similis TaxID=1736056 RepID=UPI00344E8085
MQSHGSNTSILQSLQDMENFDHLEAVYSDQDLTGALPLPIVDSPWQPKWWPQKYKWCPSFQQVSRTLAFILIAIVTWFILYITLGDTVLPPKGRIFQIVFLSVSAMLAGWLISITNLPALIGNLFIGALFQNCGVVDLDESFAEINKFLRGVALIVILVRAGLGLDSVALRRLKFDITKLGILPWITESLVLGGLAYYFLKMSWTYSLAFGFALSAISPAVTVPSLLRLKAKGYGIYKGVPTLLMAVTALTDVFSIVGFAIVQSFIFSYGTPTDIIIKLPVCLIGGVGFGLLWGFICSYCPDSQDSMATPLRVLLTLAGGVISVFGSTAVGFAGAGPLGCVVAPFISSLKWRKQGWPVGDNPVSKCFKFLWAIFEPVLFAITGAQIKLYQLQGNVILIGAGILLVGIIARTIVTIVSGIGSVFSLKEKIFCSMAMSTKATVQAALAPVLMGLISDHKSKEYQYAENIMMICILSIIVTTPPLAIYMDVFGTKFLKRDVIPEDVR